MTTEASERLSSMKGREIASPTAADEVLAADLAWLSEQAPEGPWAMKRAVHGYEYVDQRGVALHGGWNAVALLTALVNAYRAGRLVVANEPDQP